ncbi:hypothetical protein [Burkholderia sp. TSV86]|uniref:hypothetical protein n=1 Tax=Burkholderia sp. TSV86 TaxID=1385594 RepID=UPI000A51534F|nr:hypothetical protein [Burkholderia sp. TSV86]
MTDEKSPATDRIGPIFPFYLDPPMTINVCKETGELWIQCSQMIPEVPNGMIVRVTLSPAAVRELANVLKNLESYLGMPIEDLAKPSSVQ